MFPPLPGENRFFQKRTGKGAASPFRVSKDDVQMSLKARWQINQSVS
jgi:hypothetical protein